jgi:hypothetical protein
MNRFVLSLLLADSSVPRPRRNQQSSLFAMPKRRKAPALILIYRKPVTRERSCGMGAREPWGVGDFLTEAAPWRRIMG